MFSQTLTETIGTPLRCHCDHCQNNTCTSHQHGLCWAQLSLTREGEIEKKLNCFNTESRLMQNLICDDTVTKTSQAIIRCCRTDYCNQRDDFLPPLDEARKILEQLQQQQHAAAGGASSSLLSSSSNLLVGSSDGLVNAGSQQLTTTFNRLSASSSKSATTASSLLSIDQYSNIPIEFKILFIFVFAALLVSGLALFQFCYSRRRRTGHNGDHEDHSENSSGLVASDAAVYDTNSMASREPLINSNNNNNGTTNSNMSSNMISNPPDLNRASSLSHPYPHKGPWMSDETCNGKTQSTFQMSTGTGDPQNKPETSSGSGSGQPYLTQRSIAHDIELLEIVGRGYFGVVWRGEYKGEPVAVKIFSALAEPSWEREAEIYQTTLLRHKNILGFIATDKRDDVSMTGYWLVTDYYPMGALYDFLRNQSLALQDAIRMAFSIANGLAHLHIEIFGTKGKPAIAHRDLKSKNILVKNDGTCCIADLGMAVRYNSNNGVVDVPSNTRVGTRRYLAPELLDNKLNLMDFDAVKATDVYALGLVLWELLRRTCYLHPSNANAGGGPPDLSPPPSSYYHSPSPPQQPQYESPPPMQQQQEQQQEQEPQPSSMVDDQPLLGGGPNSETNGDTIDHQYNLPPTTVTLAQEQSSAAGSVSSGSGRIDQQQHNNEPTSTISSGSSNNNNENLNELAKVCEPYEAPYQDYVSLDPTAEEMRHIVCVRKIRPPLSERWSKFAPMREFSLLMCECWYEKPQARLSALRIRKTLGDIARHYFNTNMEYD